MPNNDIRYVTLEEFIPVDRVSDMLTVADKLFDQLPIQKSSVADNLRRSMVWMVKYIAPTSQFWDWQTFEDQIDNQTRLRVKFIGLGWLISLIRSFNPTDQVSPSNVESELSDVLTRITGHIPVDAVARLKSTPWSVGDLRNLTKALTPANPDVKVNKKSKTLTAPDVAVSLSDEERVRLTRISTKLDGRTHQILGDVKRWANADRRYEGADWCAYKRRRLTTVVKVIPASQEAPTTDDFSFTDEPTGLYARNQATGFDYIVEKGAATTIGTVLFPLYPYHTGVINPRVVVRVPTNLVEETLFEVLDYISYLWVNHYTRLWCYLDFEDQFAYASDIWHLKQLDEQALVDYPSKAMHFEELRGMIQMLNRVDAGEVNAYKPPHAKFSFAAANPENSSVIESLRLALIPSTITQLKIDPLVDAPSIMRNASAELNQAYGTFSQAASLRMQRLLQILQVVFILAAAAALLALIPIGNIVNSAMISLFSGDGWYRSLYKAKESISWLRQAHISLYFSQTVILLGLFVGVLALIRSKAVSRILKRYLQ